MAPEQANGGGGGAPAAAAAATPAAPAAAKDGLVFLKLVGDTHYKGTDQGTGEFLHLIKGDVARVSEIKAAQVTKDFPGLFAESDAAEFKKAQAERDKRSKELAEKVEKEEKRKAAAARTQAMEDDDED